jgi:magnesium chelatase subunit D
MVEGRKREKLYGKRVNSQSKKGKYVKSKISNNHEDVAIDATLRAAALRNGSRSKNDTNNKNNLNQNKKKYNPNYPKQNQKDYNQYHNQNQKDYKQEYPKQNQNDYNQKVHDQNRNNYNPNYPKQKSFTQKNYILSIKKEDLREKVRKHGTKLSIALVIDMSGSMLSDEKLNRIKAILQKIIANVHINRDKLAVIGFKGKDSELIIPNTKRPNSFLSKLQNITIGGTTPMAAGLQKGLEVLKKDCKSEEYIPMLMILSDGITNVSLRNYLKDSISLGSIRAYDNKALLNGPIHDVLDIGKKIADYDIHSVIINFEKEKNKGRSVNKELAFVTGGRFYDLEQLGDIWLKETFKGESIDVNSFTFGSFKNDLSEMVLENILDYERENI